jgi:hypothetical protein
MISRARVHARARKDRSIATGFIAEATMGGDSSYTELLTCLEMARDGNASCRLLKM